jgi:hypothetical protein
MPGLLMLDLIDLVSRKLDDPIVCEWAVNHYRNTRSDDDVGAGSRGAVV